MPYELLNDPDGILTNDFLNALSGNGLDANVSDDIEVYELEPAFLADQRRGAQWNGDAKQTEIWRGQSVTLNLGAAVPKVTLWLRHANQQFSSRVICGCDDGKHNHPNGK